MTSKPMQFRDKRIFSNGTFREGYGHHVAERAARAYLAVESSQGWKLYSPNDVIFPYEVKAGAQPLSSGKWDGDEIAIPDWAFEVAVKNGEQITLKAIYGQYVSADGRITQGTLWAEEDAGRWWQAGVGRDAPLTASEINGQIEIRGSFFGVFLPSSGECERVGISIKQA